MNDRQKQQKQKRGLLFWFVFLLTVSVIATSILTTMLMNKYYFDASGAIDISQNNPNAQQYTPVTDPQQNNNGGSGSSGGNGNNGGNGGGNGGGEGTGQGTPTAAITTNGGGNPSFEASSDGTIWSTNTKVDIFKSSYINKLEQITAQSHDGDKIIAPGTSNSFVFKLANTGDVPLSFELDIDAYITPEGYHLPVKARMQRYDSKWLLGGDNQWHDVPQLDNVADSGTMGAGKYFYYTLDWEWPFEIDDQYDTYLGNQAVDEDISITIVIKTYATGDVDPNAEAGITIPDTGDSSSLVLWGTMAALSLVACVGIIIFIILLKRREEEEENSALEETAI